jgi:FkbM family methyltransferase
MPGHFRSPAKILRRLRLLPAARREIKNWLSFIFNYAFGLAPRRPYRFRNGALLKLGRAIDHVPIVEIFLRKDYGTMPDRAVVVDLGANIGTFSIYAAMTGRDNRVFSYEPWKPFFEQLRGNVALNQREEVITCFNSAVAGEETTRNLYVEGSNLYFPTLIDSGDTSGAGQTVPCTTLPNIMEANRLEKIDLLKMDCEGAEYEILYPTPEAYFGKISEIRMEYHDLDAEQRNIRQLQNFLETMGYTITSRQSMSPINGTIWAQRLPKATDPNPHP